MRPVQPDSVTAEVPVVEAGSPEAEVADAEHPSVDDLFARLRASSSEVVARDVLDQEPSADAGHAANGSGEPLERRGRAGPA